MAKKSAKWRSSVLPGVGALMVLAAKGMIA
jgi:hypothetical protein